MRGLRPLAPAGAYAQWLGQAHAYVNKNGHTLICTALKVKLAGAVQALW